MFPGNGVQRGLRYVCSCLVSKCQPNQQVYKPRSFKETAQVGECSCGSVVEHCVCSANGCGFDSQGTHIMKKMYSLNAL